MTAPRLGEGLAPAMWLRTPEQRAFRAVLVEGFDSPGGFSCNPPAPNWDLFFLDPSFWAGRRNASCALSAQAHVLAPLAKQLFSGAGDDRRIDNHAAVRGMPRLVPVRRALLRPIPTNVFTGVPCRSPPKLE